ncbi:ribonuclease HII [Nocardia sp. 004]|uniref:ribonuclease HII n=1 Tax=Nocardia sp. 004 TaxID=3385978 RepID=UPI00399F40B5
MRQGRVSLANGWPPRMVMRRAGGLRTLESALIRGGLGPVAGVDEAGRGPCAGPLVVAACLLPPKAYDTLAGLDDSKKLTEAVREELYPVITRLALAYAIVVIPAGEIDSIGIHVANIEGMRRAVAGLGRTPGYVLTDGFLVPGIPVPSLPIIGGDGAAACIAAASILAKVTRDRIMVELDERFPGYGFAAHKGYNTAEHTAALHRLGPSSEHRRSWRTVREVAAARPVTKADCATDAIAEAAADIAVPEEFQDGRTASRVATDAAHAR